MTELDDALRESFARLAEPGDPAGVADAIRTRLDAGDTGTRADSSGFGGGGGPAPWLIWGAVVVVAALGGGAVGASGAIGHEVQTVVEIGPVSLSHTTPGYLCPTGPAIGELVRGERVLAIARNADSSWLSVRDPGNLASTLWVPAALVVVDADQQPVSELPLGGSCPVVSLPPLPVDEVPPASDPDPQPGPAKPPTPDTTKPTITAGLFSPNPVYGVQANQNACQTSTTIKITAADNIGVTSVTGATKAGPAGAQITQVSHSGNDWVFKYQIDYEGATSGAIIGFTAKDAAGNQAVVYAGLQVRPGHYTNCYLG